MSVVSQGQASPARAPPSLGGPARRAAAAPLSRGPPPSHAGMTPEGVGGQGRGNGGD